MLVRGVRAALAGLAGSAAVAGAVLLVAAPAGADSSTPSSTSGGATPAGGASSLGGWNLESSAAGVSVFYEQPNFPVPATPTFEFNFGYSQASYNAGPVGESNASALWPGSVVAGGGSQLPLLLDPYIEQYLPQAAPTVEPLIPNFGPWPLAAASAFPQGPTTNTNANGPVAMHSSADQNGSTASSSVGIVGGPADKSALPAGLLTIQAVGSTSQDTIDNLGNALAEATSTVHGIDIAGGLIHIGEVTSTATSSSDGNQGTVNGTSAVTGVTVAGENVSVDAQGVHVANNNEPILATVLPNVAQVLSTAGITLSLTNPADTVNGASAARQLDGLAVKIDLSTYDQNLSKLMSMLPSQLTQGLSQLPIPTPYKQSVTLDFGWVNVNAAASPPFNDTGSTDLSGDNSALSTLGTGGIDTGTPSDLGLGGSGTSPTSSGGTTPSASGPTQNLATAPAALFKGVGTGLIIIGLLLTALLVGLLFGADRAVGRLAEAAAPCIGEDVGDLG